MKTITFLLFCTLALSINAQNNWVKPNAKWYFSIWGSHPGGYQKVEHIGDTLIEGVQCMAFQESEYISYPQPNSEPILSGPIIKGKQFLHYRNDTVFYRVDNRFEILFDFNANMGDSWILNHDVEANATLECDTVSTLFIQATETFLTNGNTYKVLQLETDSVSPTGLYGKYNSRFGPFGQGYLFPTSQNCSENIIVEFYMYSFLCFEDDELAYSQQNADCNHLSNILSIKSMESQLLGVFQNPIESGNDLFVNIDGAYTIIDLNGKTISGGKVENKKISTINIEKGIYILSITSAKGTAQQKIVIK